VRKADQPKKPRKAPEVGPRSKFAGLGPDGNLDDFDQFGLGALTAKPIELILARSAFFVATRKVASEELRRLQKEVLPLSIDRLCSGASTTVLGRYRLL
jgi:hypothetical protein